MMTNETYIKSLNSEELAEYILSVYLCGVAVGKGQISTEDTPYLNYITWLKSPKCDDRGKLV